MSIDELLRELKNATTKDEQAAVVAESIIADLPLPIAQILRKCAILPWFTEEIIRTFPKDEDYIDTKELIRMITALPFVEETSKGYSFHTSTRRGLLTRYAVQNPSIFSEAYSDALPVLASHWDDDDYALVSLLGYIVTNQREEVEKRFREFQTRVEKNKKPRQMASVFDAFDEIESLPIPSGMSFPLSYWAAKAAALASKGDLKRATRYVQRALELEPKNLMALDLMSKIRALEGDFKGALEINDSAVDLSPSSRTFASRAETYKLSGNSRRAISDISKAIDLAASDKRVQALHYIQRGQIYEEFDKKDLAIADFNRAMELVPDQVEGYIVRGWIYLLKKNYAGAIRDFGKGLELAPEMRDWFLRMRARAYQEEGNLASALIDINSALQFAPNDAGLLVVRAKIYFETDQYDKALADCLVALEQDSQNPGPYSLAAEIYAKQGRHDEARSFFMRAIQTSENPPEFYEEIAEQAYYDFEYLDVALAAAYRAVALEPESDYANGQVGFLLLLQGNFTEAGYYLERAFNLDKYKINNAINLGILQWRLNDSARARDYFNLALREIERTYPKRKKRARRSASNDAWWGWLQILLGNKEVGIISMRSYLNQKEKGYLFIDLKCWTNMILQGELTPPDGLIEIGERLNQSPK